MNMANGESFWNGLGFADETALEHKQQADDEEPVDHLPQLRKDCVKSCPGPKADYDACVKRIEKSGTGDCEAWYFDLIHCVDKCVAPKAFKPLK